MSESNTSKCLKIVAAVVFPNIGGYFGGKITRANIEPWYNSLNQPSWSPPKYVFAPVWTSIYCGIGYASYLVYRDLIAAGNGFDGMARVALVLYVNQMALNWAWTPIFFKYHSLKWSAIELTALTMSAALCGYAFGRINKLAGYIFIPYVAWCCFATYLNYTVYQLNQPDDTAKVTEIKDE